MPKIIKTNTYVEFIMDEKMWTVESFPGEVETYVVGAIQHGNEKRRD